MPSTTTRQTSRRGKSAARGLKARFRRQPRVDAADVIAVHMHVGQDGRSRRDADLADTLEAIRRHTA